MKTKLFHLLTQKYSIIAIIIISSILSLTIDRNIGFFFGLGVVIFITHQRKWDWCSLGMYQKLSLKTVLNSIWMTLGLVIIAIVSDIYIEHYFGKSDISSLEGIQGNFISYLIMLIVVWVFAAFGEEILFRGYYMKGFAELMGGSKKAWYLSMFIMSVYFGISHAYLGLSGVIGVTIIGLFFAFVFYKNQKNLTLLVLIHGFYDTVGITLIYLGKYDTLFEELEHVLLN